MARNTKDICMGVYIYENIVCVCVFIWQGLFKYKCCLENNLSENFFAGSKLVVFVLPSQKTRALQTRGRVLNVGTCSEPCCHPGPGMWFESLCTFSDIFIHLLWQGPCSSSPKSPHFSLASLSLWNGAKMACWAALSKVKRQIHSHLGLGRQVSAGMKHLQVHERRGGHFRWVCLIKRAIGTFQMLLGEGKVGIKGNLQPMEMKIKKHF